MPRLLVSVRSAAEARTALAGGAALIDVKEPSRGSLGAASPQVWQEVLAEVDGAAPVSAALGELREAAAADLGPRTAGLGYVKIGLAGCRTVANWQAVWRDVSSRLPRGSKLVAVAYADWQAAQAPAPADVMRVGVGIGCEGFLVDTFDKSGGDLFDHLAHAIVADLVGAAHSCGLTAVLGGSLTAKRLPEVLALNPDYLAVRGAVCRGGRTGTVDRQLVRDLCQLLA